MKLLWFRARWRSRWGHDMRLEIRAFFRQVESDHLLVHSRVLYGCEEKKKQQKWSRLLLTRHNIFIVIHMTSPKTLHKSVGQHKPFNIKYLPQFLLITSNSHRYICLSIFPPNGTSSTTNQKWRYIYFFYFPLSDIIICALRYQLQT